MKLDKSTYGKDEIQYSIFLVVSMGVSVPEMVMRKEDERIRAGYVKGARVRLNKFWGEWSHSEVRKQLHLWRSSDRGWPIGTFATIVGYSTHHKCVRIKADHMKTPTSFNIDFLDLVSKGKDDGLPLHK